MSYTSGFFDAIDQGGGDYDRVYSAATFAHYFSLLVKNGVFPDPSTGLQVRASSSPNMQVSVSPGSGWINGYYITVPDNSPEVLTVPTANPSLSRYDSVIMGLNFVDREIQLYIKSGAVSASPSPVTLQRDNDLYELELARISVGAGAASITQSMITDTRSDSTRCGIVAGMIDQIDTTDLFAQYDDAFQTWFADLQAQLSGNIAANLQKQINQLKNGLEQTNQNLDSSVNKIEGSINFKEQLRTYTSQNWVCPDGVYSIDAYLVGGGGGGANSSIETTNYACGGGGGYCKLIRRIPVIPGTSYPLIVGAGGEAATDGGTTTAFGYSAPGGKAGTLSKGGDGGSGGGGGVSRVESPTKGGEWGKNGELGARSGGTGGGSIDYTPLNPYDGILYGSGGGGGGGNGDSADYRGGSGGGLYGGLGGIANQDNQVAPGDGGIGSGGGGGGHYNTYPTGVGNFGGKGGPGGGGGGGGGGLRKDAVTGGSGGSGCVIIYYPEV